MPCAATRGLLLVAGSGLVAQTSHDLIIYNSVKKGEPTEGGPSAVCQMSNMVVTGDNLVWAVCFDLRHILDHNIGPI